MKAVFLSYNQALTDRVNAILDKQGIRGFTKWALTEGRGSVDGEPHYGTHAWPSMNASILAIVDDEKVAPLMDAFREMDAATRMQGARARTRPVRFHPMGPQFLWSHPPCSVRPIQARWCRRQPPQPQ